MTYELRLFGTNLGEFEKFVGSMQDCMKIFYTFCSKNILQQFTFEKIM